MSIRRMRLEYSILLERLEERAVLVPNVFNNEAEDMSPPPSPSGLDDSFNSKFSRGGLKKGKRKPAGSPPNPLSAKAQRIRDPLLPKRPTNAYLIFCDAAKERVRKELEERSPGAATDLSKALTEAWKNLNADLRKPYYKLYEEDRDRYQREMTEYNKRKVLELEDERNGIKRQKNEDTADPEPELKEATGEPAEAIQAEAEAETEVQNETPAPLAGNPE